MATKVGINGMLITVKRNSLLKAYETYTESDETSQKEEVEKYLEKLENCVSFLFFCLIENFFEFF